MTWFTETGELEGFPNASIELHHSLQAFVAHMVSESEHTDESKTSKWIVMAAKPDGEKMRDYKFTLYVTRSPYKPKYVLGDDK